VTIPTGSEPVSVAPAPGLTGTLNVQADAVSTAVASIPAAVLGSDGSAHPADADAIALISEVAASRIYLGNVRASSLASSAAAAVGVHRSGKPLLPPPLLPPAGDSTRVAASTSAVVNAAVDRSRSVSDDLADARADLIAYASGPNPDAELVLELESVLGKLARSEFFGTFSTAYLAGLHVLGPDAGAGWIRQTTDDPCGQCQLWDDGKIRPFSVQMKSHDNDECVPVPVTDEEANGRDRSDAREPVAHRTDVAALNRARSDRDAGGDAGRAAAGDPVPA
jgi:hypothetical protein